jgi:hypothetical protein
MVILSKWLEHHPALLQPAPTKTFALNSPAHPGDKVVGVWLFLSTFGSLAKSISIVE